MVNQGTEEKDQEDDDDRWLKTRDKLVYIRQSRDYQTPSQLGDSAGVGDVVLLEMEIRDRGGIC